MDAQGVYDPRKWIQFNVFGLQEQSAGTGGFYGYEPPTGIVLDDAWDMGTDTNDHFDGFSGGGPNSQGGDAGSGPGRGEGGKESGSFQNRDRQGSGGSHATAGGRRVGAGGFVIPAAAALNGFIDCLLYTSPSPRD